MSIAQATANKATFSRFQDAVNTGDAEVISKTIDEVVERDPSGRVQGPPTNQQIHHLQRDFYLPLRRRPNRRDLGVVDVLAQMKQLGMIPA
jgi:hypothetical protein